VTDEDDRKGGQCDHQRCPAGDCQMLKPEALIPTDEDREYVQGLINDGWFSVSTRHRSLQKGAFSFHNPQEVTLTIKQWKAWREAGGPTEGERRAGYAPSQVKEQRERHRALNRKLVKTWR